MHLTILDKLVNGYGVPSMFTRGRSQWPVWFSYYFNFGRVYLDIHLELAGFWIDFYYEKEDNPYDPELDLYAKLDTPREETEE